MTRGRDVRPRAGSAISTIIRAVVTASASALASRALLRTRGRLPAPLNDRWARTNHAGRPVTLLEGPAWVGGALVGSAVSARLRGRHGPSRPGSPRTSMAVATATVSVASGLLGALDDLAGGASDKGLKGHLGALARGEVTTGAIKILGLALTGLAGAAIVDHARPRHRGEGATRIFTTIVGGAVIAGAANAVNLFDLRPGRALKVTIAAALPLAASTPAPVSAGSSLGVIADDLRAASMLGDTGANAAGALLGLAVVERSGLVGRAVALAALSALTLASERVSFTAVIEANPVLRRLDEWGRGPIVSNAGAARGEPR